ncbi:MAG: 16S rRNA (uracil(1498)-N(3))-methyltransferase [Gammaproteobacteria bacterium]|nr:16S rRNA (uracil(1498)-N(3))-methyltransferase [Gammaproteobacteria bacterium]
MRLRRLFVEEPLAGRTELSLRGAAARHAGTVLRLGPGDELRVFDGRGGEFAARVGAAGKGQLCLALGEFFAEASAPALRAMLWQGVARSERMDFTIQKATELGVETISPVIMRRSVVRLEGERAERRRRHWQALAASAAEQSGRTRVPAILEPAPLEDLLRLEREAGHDLLLEPGAPVSLASLRHDPAENLTLLAGPEGGFDDAEREMAVAAGFRTVGLGPRVLRTETAAIVALSIAQAQWGDLR